jgi:hypothetical protein
MANNSKLFNKNIFKEKIITSDINKDGYIILKTNLNRSLNFVILKKSLPSLMKWKTAKIEMKKEITTPIMIVSCLFPKKVKSVPKTTSIHGVKRTKEKPKMEMSIEIETTDLKIFLFFILHKHY